MNKQDFQKATIIANKINIFISVKKHVDDKLLSLWTAIPSGLGDNGSVLKEFVDSISDDFRPVFRQIFDDKIKNLQNDFDAIGQSKPIEIVSKGHDAAGLKILEQSKPDYAHVLNEAELKRVQRNERDRLNRLKNKEIKDTSGKI